AFGTRKPKRIPKRCAFHHLVEQFVVTWESHANRKVCSAFKQQLGYRNTPIPILRRGVENWRLPTNTGPIDRRTRIYVRSTIKKKLGRFRISELCSNMQQRRSLQGQATSCGTAAVQFLDSPMDKIRCRIQFLGHSVKSTPEQIQKARHLVLRSGPCSD